MSGVLQRKGKWFEQEAVAARDSQTSTADCHCRFCGLPSLLGRRVHGRYRQLERTYIHKHHNSGYSEDDVRCIGTDLPRWDHTPSALYEIDLMFSDNSNVLVRRLPHSLSEVLRTEYGV